MKRAHGGCFRRVLDILIVLGVISALLLGYMGLKKADEAEANRTPVAELGAVYAGETAASWDALLLDTVMKEFIGDSAVLNRLRSLLGDDSAAALITESYYLPADGDVSTAIGRRVLVHRLKKAYSEQELFAIYCGIMGYDAADEESLLSLIEGIGLSGTAPEDLTASDVLRDILNYLNEQDLLSDDYTEKLNAYFAP
ncbi:MAG: hypothetical protein ACOX8R_08455 [Bacillota bacterium]|jgi:hypothetical protein